MLLIVGLDLGHLGFCLNVGPEGGVGLHLGLILSFGPLLGLVVGVILGLDLKFGPGGSGCRQIGKAASLRS